MTHAKLVADLRRLGLSNDDTVMVHSSMRAVGPVLGGPDVVIRALLEVVGEAGTVLAYADWEHGVQEWTREDTGQPDWEARFAELPPFDPRTSRARRAYGVLPEFLRTWPGAARSGNPDASVTALGGKAAWLCADHPLQYGYGPGSPLAKLVQLEGKVLLLGAPLDTVTLLHHAEHAARLPDKRIVRYYEPLVIDGRKEWVRIEEFDTSRPVVAAAPETYFADLVRDYQRDHATQSGLVGLARAHVLEAARLHRYAVEWMETRWG